MLDNICQYSTIILAGNLTVLLIISVSTDYWEYRNFDRAVLRNGLSEAKQAHLFSPPDTDSYMIINHTKKMTHDMFLKVSHFPNTKRLSGDTSKVVSYQQDIYEPPAFARRTFSYPSGQECTDVEEKMDDDRNQRIPTFDLKTQCVENVLIVLFEGYGNLFRDCDGLEGGVRRRLGMGDYGCHVLFRSDTRHSREILAVPHLERAAFLFALLAIAAMFVNLMTGVYGSSVKHRALLLAASFAALTSGICFTIAIALFHGKCHLLRINEFMERYDIPYKREIEAARQFEFGWSFVLAWVCVVLSFVSSWTWLYKSQDMRPKFITRRLKSHLIGSRITGQTLNGKKEEPTNPLFEMLHGDYDDDED